MAKRCGWLALWLCAAVRVFAATPQEQVEARRQINPRVIVHVITGETLKGSIERAMKDEFYLADEGGLDRILVPYFAVKELIDPDSGERIPLDAPKEPPPSTSATVAAADKAASSESENPGAPLQLRESSLPMTWLFAIAAVAAMWVVFRRRRL